MNHNHSLNRYASFTSSIKNKGNEMDENIEPDNTVSQLRSKIFNLEQNEKCYYALELKYKTVKNDLIIANESKLRFEYDFKKKAETSNKIIFKLQNENEQLNKELNEKQLMNSSLFNDNNSLYLDLENITKENEINKNELKKRNEIMNELSDELDAIKEKNIKLQALLKQKENEYNQLNEISNEQKRDINILIHNNTIFNSKVKSIQDTLQLKQNEIDAKENKISKLQGETVNIEQILNKTKSELFTLNNILSKEKRHKLELEDNILQLNQNIKHKSNEIEKMGNELEHLKSNYNKKVQECNNGSKDIECYKSHIMLITQLNEKLTTELELVSEGDNKIKYQLNQSDRIATILRNIKNEIGISLKKIEEGLSNPNFALSIQSISID